MKLYHRYDLVYKFMIESIYFNIKNYNTNLEYFVYDQLVKPRQKL